MSIFRLIARKISMFIQKFREAMWTKRNIRIIESYESVPNIHGETTLTGRTHLGENCNFNGLKIEGGGKVVIGDNFHSGQDVLIITQTHNYDEGGAIPYDASYIYKDVVIEDNVWVGSRVIILGGTKIGEGAIIQAGSVVAKDIPKYAIAGGHPAEPFSYRDIDHYERLKKKGRYH